jgi:rubrerythrin
MASSHSMYKHPSKLAKATPIQKLHSILNRRERDNHIKIYVKSLNERLLKEEIRHDKNLLAILKEKEPKLFSECLKLYDERFGKMKRKRERKLQIMKENFKRPDSSQISGWIERQIEILEKKETSHLK